MSALRIVALGCVTAAFGAASMRGAEAQANCDTYGKLALRQQQENVELKCGFTGPQWAPDLKAHVAWCAGVGPDRWKAELQARQLQLDACKAK
ncbi:hypothetical protein [Hyphomicrobium sp. CS1GBMeth3]|uniref:hypothetical protein n=1 Tax=Hyphomicrobium sp. CS1GBMeth3 TaxID=1892845 RepID=UPI0009315017|nr:hypothetical protein [Hyphomicrobium sp. CS1GBMeth3]